MADNLYPPIVGGVTTGAEAKTSINQVGSTSEVAMKTASAFDNISTEIGYYKTGTIVFALSEKKFYKYSGSAWVEYDDIPTLATTYTQDAIDTLLLGKEDVSNKDTTTSLGTSDSKYPSQKAVKSYVDSHINATGTSVHGLGDMSTQTSSAVSVTGGTVYTTINDSVNPPLKATQSGNGISAQFGDGTNNSIVEKDGTLRFDGAATVFDDLPCFLFVAKTGTSNVPTWGALVGNINAYTFAVNDWLEFATELLHGYKEGSNLEIHIHWATNGSNADDRYVKWEVEYSIANMNGGTFGSSTIISSETKILANTATKTNMYTSIGTISGSTFTIGAQLMLRIRRIAATSGSAPSANPYATSVGIHYEKDTVGSRQISTK
jgi:hypothetical protein